MTRSERLIALIQFLEGRRVPISADAVAKELNVSTRSVYRDVACLRKSGVDVEAISGVGIRLAEDAQFPRLNLDADAWAAVALGLDMVVARSDPVIAQHADRAKRAMRQALPEAIRRQIDGSGLVAGPRAGQTVAIDITNLLAGNVKLDLRYLSLAGAISERRVWPVAVGFFESVEVLAAWCELRGGWRHFRLDHIWQAKPSPDRLPRARAVLFAQWQRDVLRNLPPDSFRPSPS